MMPSWIRLALSPRSIVRFLNPTSRWHTLFLAIEASAWLSRTLTAARWRHIVGGFLVGSAFLFCRLSGVFLASGVLLFLLLEKPGAGVVIS
jgi:hypothetical protein